MLATISPPAIPRRRANIAHSEQAQMAKMTCKSYKMHFCENYFGTPRKRVPSEMNRSNSEKSKKGLATCDFHANIARSEQAQMAKMTCKSCKMHFFLIFLTELFGQFKKK